MSQACKKKKALAVFWILLSFLPACLRTPGSKMQHHYTRVCRAGLPPSRGYVRTPGNK